MSAKLALVDTGYRPREHQVQIHEGLQRFNIAICHRRFGKSHLGANILVHLALTSQKKLPRLFYIAPNYAQAKRVIWDILKSYTSMIPGVEYNEAELRIDFPHNGARIQLLSAENPAALKGIYADFVVLDEYGDMTPVVWREAVRPTLSDRCGGALFIGTVKGVNHFWKLYLEAKKGTDPEWAAWMFKASETKIIPESELDSARRTMSYAEYMQEYECDPLAGLVGAYFAHEMSQVYLDKRIGQYPYDPSTVVDTYWDLGINDATSVWFVQSRMDQHRFIDYYEVSGLSIPKIIVELKRKPYVFGRFYLPHDVMQTELGSGQARVQSFRSNGIREITVVPRVREKMDSINAARVALAKCWFDEEKCARGVEALSNYKKKWDEKRETFADTPLHDWASNGADAFQQFAIAHRRDSTEGSSNQFSKNHRGEPVAITEYDPLERSYA